ncbi:uracil-DNA glycosylase [Neisseria sp. Ec49-e6-T10]|uniref:uracil-DNA glycosylase n=1 Tax=Neisseria sp. Ec49-e6-T10 TaxID=3140744 RepID=UPI003EBCA220
MNKPANLRDYVPLFIDALNSIHPSWRPCFQQKEVASALRQCHELYKHAVENQQIIYPPAPQIFAALKQPVDSIKCVILGQDPYHGPDQANGLAFSVGQGVAIPPSLRNIYLEIEQDLGIKPPSHGDLTAWVQQGVLLLNTGFSVAQAQAGSHQTWPWFVVSDALIQFVSQASPACVFLLWGRHAQNKQPLVDTSKHLVLTAPHPSPLSAHRGFLGCKHFSQTNQFLTQKGLAEINWQIS